MPTPTNPLTIDIKHRPKGPFDADVFHAGDNLLVGHQDLPDGRLVGLLDDSVHPFNEVVDHHVVVFYFHVDVVVAWVQLWT